MYGQKENKDFGVPLNLLPPASIWQLVFAFLPASGAFPVKPSFQLLVYSPGTVQGQFYSAFSWKCGTKPGKGVSQL